MYLLEISMAGEIDFSIVGICLILGAIVLMVVYGIIEEAIINAKERRERKRRNRNRKGYVTIDRDWRY